MSAKSLFSYFVSIGMIFLTACNLTTGTDKKDSDNAHLPNPASVYCEENGGTLEIRTAEDGSQSGMCVFPDGSECDEWAFFRNECKPGESLAMNANMPNPASVFCKENGGKLEIRSSEDGSQSGMCVFSDGSECDEWAYFRSECKPGESLVENPEVMVVKADDGCFIYHNDDLNYSFHYPSDATITENDDPTHSFTIQGPMLDDNYWPMIMIAHPQDRGEYRPPEGSDLEQWLADQNLIDDENYELMEIAGSTALHTRIESGGQSYNFDHYYFANKDQLLSIVILHTGGKEDWELYDHFLESFAFDDL